MLECAATSIFLLLLDLVEQLGTSCRRYSQIEVLGAVRGRG